jgi:hypothetical protein
VPGGLYTDRVAQSAARAALWLTWNGKKAVKTLSPAGFRLVRRVLTGLS